MKKTLQVNSLFHSARIEFKEHIEHKINTEIKHK
jgi:hypothetical protein